jgi:hypothetical protein
MERQKYAVIDANARHRVSGRARSMHHFVDDPVDRTSASQMA